MESLEVSIAGLKDAGNHSAFMNGRELLGRHIGASNDNKRLDRRQAEFFTYLGSATEKFKHENSVLSDPSISLETSSRIVW